MNYFNSEIFYIFGSGSTAKLFKSILEKNNKKVISFLVSKGQSSEIENIPVIDLSKNTKEIDLSVPVIIAVLNREKNAHMNFITEYLKGIKFVQIISLYDFFDKYSTQIDSLYWLTDKKYYQENISNILSVKELFKESKSLDIFSRIIEFQRTFDSNVLHLPNLKINISQKI